MKTPLRVGVAVLLIFTALWFKGHLDIIESQWQQYRNLVTSTQGKGSSETSSTGSQPSTSPASAAPESETEQLSSPEKTEQDGQALPGSQPISEKTKTKDQVVVVGRLKDQNTDWVIDDLPDWDHAIYIVDDPTAPLHVVKNKGREANVYLQYIIDHYDRLPSTIVFLHSHRDGFPQAWHTEFDEHSNPQTVNMLQTEFVQRNGYANLRCTSSPGCPDEVRPFRDPPDEGRWTEHAFPEAWNLFFNGTEVPEVIATPCCAQFAVSKKQVLQRPLSDYEMYHRWVMETELADDVSGRVMEYMWHIIFGQDPVYCPDTYQCYSDVYGLPDPFDFGW
ncbi:hypothetical protein ASPWEDRAFT_115648 [Aspergillus wentii DTO 134E9]|uniref:DUF3431 domain-containing protein n=1 Tax=Aspergillus wentii DTO 134E9 TaxID=1073089 RepID=A0A1L9RCW4_ASPWE|nr:uncharacterized protein ASPWEDRAFT_115648 [Aspergillus wentii DTO 134E9]KAI9924329.1 hypothetical protein MW887_007281 [Aspergillus wentii]OJJ32752.1 hypothetical protein ASPWEDRAFT_115648 [Aspergillus wentii DTO 134E9]